MSHASGIVMPSAKSAEIIHAQCPQCEARYRITPEQIQAGLRKLKCAKCKAVFTIDRPDEPPADSPALADETTESWEERRSSASTGQLFAGLLVAVVLVALLAAQYAWFQQRDWVLQNETIRPWLALGCGWVGCELPVTRAASAFRTREWVIEPHPKVAGAVVARIRFHNQARFAQPFPELELIFSDENDQPVGGRRFSPAEYLRDPGANQDLIRPGEAVSAKLEIQNVVRAMHNSTGVEIRYF